MVPRKLDATRELNLSILKNLTEDDRYRLVGGARRTKGMSRRTGFSLWIG